MNEESNLYITYYNISGKKLAFKIKFLYYCVYISSLRINMLVREVRIYYGYKIQLKFHMCYVLN
jgi:hypothetical protein